MMNQSVGRLLCKFDSDWVDYWLGALVPGVDAKVTTSLGAKSRSFDDANHTPGPCLVVSAKLTLFTPACLLAATTDVTLKLRGPNSG
jgi:hypothetical protein